MAEASFNDKFLAYRPSKKLWFWSTAACMAAVVVLGFTWGGWVTSGTAADRASAAADQATAKLAAAICEYRFLNAPNAASQLAAFDKQDTYDRGDFLKKGGWATVDGGKSPVAGAASICANELADAKLPAAAAATTASTATTTN